MFLNRGDTTMTDLRNDAMDRTEEARQIDKGRDLGTDARAEAMEQTRFDGRKAQHLGGRVAQVSTEIQY